MSMKQKQGFIGNDILVIDFQQTKTNLKSNRLQLDKYKQQYQHFQKTIGLANTLKEDMLSQQTF